MANITLTVPDADLPDLVAALAQGWQPQIPDPNYPLVVHNAQGVDVPNPQPQRLVPNPQPRADYARAQLAAIIAGLLSSWRQAQHAQAFQPPATQITAS